MLYKYLSYSPQIDSTVYIAPTATIIGRAIIGTESSVWFNTVIRADINSIEIGSQTNIQDSCALHVTNQFGIKINDRVTIGHGAILHGCTIESDCLIAMGAIVLDGAVIKSGSMVAAGAVVPPGSLIPPNALVMGAPAKVTRILSEQDKDKLKRNWQNYLGYARTYLDPKSVQVV